MRFLVLLVLLMTGCERDEYKTFVKCEPPYYSGEVNYASTSKEGTWIRSKAGESFEYPPSVKCEVHHSKEYK